MGPRVPGKNGTSREIDSKESRGQGPTHQTITETDCISMAETTSPSGKGSLPVPKTPEPRLEGHEAESKKTFQEERFWCIQAGGRRGPGFFGDRTGVSVFKETRDRTSKCWNL